MQTEPKCTCAFSLGPSFAWVAAGFLTALAPGLVFGHLFGLAILGFVAFLAYATGALVSDLYRSIRYGRRPPDELEIAIARERLGRRRYRGFPWSL